MWVAGRLTLDVEPTWRSGYYEVVMEIDLGDKVRRDYAFFVVCPTLLAYRRCALDQYCTLQRLWRAESLQRRHPGRHAATDGGRLPLQVTRQSRRVTATVRPIRRTLRTSATSSSTIFPAGLDRRGGPTGTALHPVG